MFGEPVLTTPQRNMLRNYTVFSACRALYQGGYSPRELFIRIDGKDYPLSTVTSQPSIPNLTYHSLSLDTGVPQ
jgi:hypothetical protein